MKHLTKLFKLLELTRSQPQSGYALAGIPLEDLSSLASHHYLTTFFAWQITLNLNNVGAGLNVQRVLELCLIHDLGELFGGDIAMPYAIVNPKARELAKAFEMENQKFLANYFGKAKDNFNNLGDEVFNAESDEGLIYKIADYIECIHYKLYLKELAQEDLDMVSEKLAKMAGSLKNEPASKVLSEFLESWEKDLLRDNSESQILNSK